MTEPDPTESGLQEVVTGLYAGPLDTFVARRDALVRELRAAARKDDAATVRNLRKPSRVAWALDLGVLGTPHAMQSVDGALSDILAAHSGTGDVRTAMTGLRNAVRELAAHAARAAEREGVPVDAGTLSHALQTVLGSQDSLELLRRGCLAEVPENDGLDFLATLPSVTPQRSQPQPAAQSTAAPDDREARARAEAAVAEARKQAQAAQKALREAEAGLEAAEKMLRAAEAKAQAMRADLEHATKRAEGATEELRRAEAL